MVVATSLGLEAPDPQTGEPYGLGFEARAPRLLLLRPAGERPPGRIEGATLPYICTNADLLWPPLSHAPPPTAGMLVWHAGSMWTIAVGTRSLIPASPALIGRWIYRIVLVPVEGFASRRGVSAVATEFPVEEWPHGFLIHDPLDLFPQ